MKSVGERIAQILDSTASSQEKLPAEKVKQQITVNNTVNLTLYNLIVNILYS